MFFFTSQARDRDLRREMDRCVDGLTISPNTPLGMTGSDNVADLRWIHLPNASLLPGPAQSGGTTKIRQFFIHDTHDSTV